jgi:GT2 family glycosyltransferase
MEPKIPIIILNWNGIDDTIECLDSVMKLNGDNYVVYLIDNNSEIEQQEKIKELFSANDKIELRFNKTNKGFTHAHIDIWEEELKNENTPYIALLNNDTVVDSNWLNELIQLAKTRKAFIVASKMINYYNRKVMDNAGHRMLNTGEIIPIGHNEPIDDYNKELETIGACAGACLYDTQMLTEIGFFDPHFSTGYEDAEIGLRAVVSGYKSVYAPQAIVYHKMGQSIKKVFNEEYSIMIHSAILYSYFKCMPKLNIITALPSFIFKYMSMFIIDIVFWRPKYLRIMKLSWKNLFSNQGNWKAKKRKLSSKKITYLNHKQFINFLWFDIKRFWRIIILKEDSAIDEYGKS